MIQFGVRYCGMNFFDAKDEDWNFHLGVPGTWSKKIDFRSQFSSEPEVFVAISSINSSNSPRISLHPTNITRKGFVLNVSLVAGSDLAGIGVLWIASDDYMGAFVTGSLQ